MKITFHGAASEVTGSQHLIETNNLRVLLDCGLFQGSRAQTRTKNERFRCDPTKLDGVVLSHAHIDHSGNLPGLYRAGFRGPIFCTRATADIAGIMLRDSARIQAEDACYLPGHLKEGHPPVEPLYDEQHVREVEKLFEPLEYGEWHDLSPEFRLRFSDAGHILGSAISEMQIADAGDMRRVVFTGDLGRRQLPLLRDPTLIGGCDVLIGEATYGNKVHPPPENLKADLLRIIIDAANNGGRVIIPAFSLGRTQQIVYFLNELMEEGSLASIPLFVDSPLATRLTEVYRRHQHELDDEAQQSLRLDDDLFEFPGLQYVQSRQESVALNRRQGPFVVISASGMCENGRVVHHLKHAISDARNTVLIIGYQAEHTLGRRLVEQQPHVRIFDRNVPLRAKVEVLSGLSAHADAEDFKWWYEHMARESGIGQAFLVHGETRSLEAMAHLIHDFCDEDAIIPELHQSFDM
jgi:metallo-beta-lactamase family protein